MTSPEERSAAPVRRRRLPKLRLPAILIAPERLPLLEKLVFFVYVLFLPLLAVSRPGIFRDADVDWHVATGQWIIEHNRVPETDPFSFSMAGAPWVPHEWLADVLYAVAFEAAGYAGLAAVVMSALIALHLVIFLHLRKRIGPIAILIVLVLLDLALGRFMLARPHVLVWPVVALWTALLIDSRDSNRAPPLWLAGLMLLWVNLHGSFLLGFGIAGLVGLDALIRSRFDARLLGNWLLFGIVSAAASLVNANGFSAFVHPLLITGMESLATIGEWRPSRPSADPFFYALLLCVTGFFLVSGRKVRPVDALLLLILLLMAFTHVRHQTWLLIIGGLILPPVLSPGSGSTALRGPLLSGAWRAGAVAAGIGLLAFRAALPMEPGEHRHNPRSLIAAIPPELRGQPVFNDYSFGGRLILAGIRPYIDGRADMYGDAFVQEYRRIYDGNFEAFDAAVARYGISWTILPVGSPLVGHLDRSPGWRRVRSDEIGVIHVRQG